MIPRIHKRGTSFKTAVAYILHDPQKETSDRVDWASCVNCGAVEPAAAWQPMYDTWNRRTALKREAGVDLRGADNKAPVMHYTLAWAPGDRPTAQEMTAAAIMSLKALGLQDHQAVMAAHNDKDHLHVHIVVNTVHPVTGKTAPLKFPALALREFAREHDRQREAWNAARSAAAEKQAIDNSRRFRRNAELREKSMAMLRPEPMLEKIRPVPREPHHRRRALEKRDTIMRMRRHRAENDHAHMVEKDALWAVHRNERDELYRRSLEASEIARDYVRGRFKSRWRELYEVQRKEWKHLEYIQDKPLERAVYVFVNSERLGNGSALTARETAALIASPSKLFNAVERLHTRERGNLAQIEKVETGERLDRAWRTHEASFANMRARQSAERESMRAAHKGENDRTVNYYAAGKELEDERRGLIPERRAANAHAFETDEMYVSRIRKEIDAHYRGQFGPDSVPFIPWGEPPAPATETPTESPNSSEEAEVAKFMAEWMRRQQERDFDNER